MCVCVCVCVCVCGVAVYSPECVRVGIDSSTTGTAQGSVTGGVQSRQPEGKYKQSLYVWSYIISCVVFR